MVASLISIRKPVTSIGWLLSLALAGARPGAGRGMRDEERWDGVFRMIL